MKLKFSAISEPGHPGLKWQKLFYEHWPDYQNWLHANSSIYTADLASSQAALRLHMPEMMPTYERLCVWAHADELAASFLTGFQPPAYVHGCSQAVVKAATVQLVRNYDYHAGLVDGTVLMSAWNGKKVMAVTDSLVGVLDGMNEDGLAISLAFGGRKEVGPGFGIPMILRYVLEFCSNVKEAVEVLVRVPSNMSYNVTVVDRSGIVKTVQVAPDRQAFVSNTVFATNHQGVVEWPENALFNQSLERSAFLAKKLSERNLDAEALADSFLQPPLYNTLFEEGFGTLYTSVYRPNEGTMQLRWPHDMMLQSFDYFIEQDKLITYK